MAKQQRAERTSRRLVLAAAQEFDRHGFTAATMARICDRAGVSVGALTFHFSTKSRVAEAVARAARQEIDEALDRTRKAVGPAPVLVVVIRLIEDLAELLSRDVVVRAGVRLVREGCGLQGWWSWWLPTVRELVGEAGDRGELRAGVDPGLVVLLTALLVEGVEWSVRSRGRPAMVEQARVHEQLPELWDLVLRGAGSAGWCNAEMPKS